MFYETAAAATLIISAISIIAHLIVVPMLLNSTGLFVRNFEHRIRDFQLLSEKADLQMAEKRILLMRRKRHVTDCPPPEPGPVGPEGVAGEDGEVGDDGPVGLRGKDERELYEEIEEKCVICPQGERGPVGAPGNQGEPGPKGEKGPSGVPGIDGQDGEMGEEGPEGYKGADGKRGLKGPDGKPATGGIGEPGPRGLPGPIGRTGAQGPRGKRNYLYGPVGPPGKKGVRGMDGLPGSFGPRGERGPAGEPGANAMFCPCPNEMEKLGDNDKPLRAAGSQNLRSNDQSKQLPLLPENAAIIVRGIENANTNPLGISIPKSQLRLPTRAQETATGVDIISNFVSTALPRQSEDLSHGKYNYSNAVDDVFTTTDLNTVNRQSGDSKESAGRGTSQERTVIGDITFDDNGEQSNEQSNSAQEVFSFEHDNAGYHPLNGVIQTVSEMGDTVGELYDEHSANEDTEENEKKRIFGEIDRDDERNVFDVAMNNYVQMHTSRQYVEEPRSTDPEDVLQSSTSRPVVITGYPEDDQITNRRHFIYVTKIPRRPI